MPNLHVVLRYIPWTPTPVRAWHRYHLPERRENKWRQSCQKLTPGSFDIPIKPIPPFSASREIHRQFQIHGFHRSSSLSAWNPVFWVNKTHISMLKNQLFSGWTQWQAPDREKKNRAPSLRAAGSFQTRHPTQRGKSHGSAEQSGIEIKHKIKHKCRTEVRKRAITSIYNSHL